MDISTSVDVDVPELENRTKEQPETSSADQLVQEGEELIKEADLSERIISEDAEGTQFPDATETSQGQDNHEDLLNDDENMEQLPEEEAHQEVDKNAESMEIVPPDENHEEQLIMEESCPDTNVEIEEEEEEENNHATTLQLGRIKKIMKICLMTNEAVDENTTLVKKPVKKGRGSKKADASTKNQGTSSFMLSKEAIFLTAVATVYFKYSKCTPCRNINLIIDFLSVLYSRNYLWPPLLNSRVELQHPQIKRR